MIRHGDTIERWTRALVIALLCVGLCSVGTGQAPESGSGAGPAPGPAAPGSVVDQLLAPRDGFLGLDALSGLPTPRQQNQDGAGFRLELDSLPLNLGAGVPGQGPGAGSSPLDPKLRLGPGRGQERQDRRAPRSPRRGSPLLADLLRIQVEEGNIALAEARYDDAVRAWQACTELLPRDYRLFVKLGEAQFGLGDYEQAEAAMRKAVELNPRSHVAQCNYGVILFKRGKIEEADRALNEALSLSPDHAVINLNLACVFASLGQTRQAVQFLRRAIGENPRQVGAFMLDPELDPIRGDEEFQAIYTQLAQADLIPELRPKSAVDVASGFEGAVAPVGDEAEPASGAGPLLSLRQAPPSVGLQLTDPLAGSTNAAPSALP